MLDRGPQGVGVPSTRARRARPGVQVGVDHDAGDFADDVRERGDFVQTFAPSLELFLFGVGTQVRVAAMIENEVDVRTLFDQVYRPGELARQYAEVECQTVVFERFHVLDESGSGRELVRFGVENAPKA